MKINSYKITEDAHIIEVSSEDFIEPWQQGKGLYFADVLECSADALKNWLKTLNVSDLAISLCVKQRKKAWLARLTNGMKRITRTIAHGLILVLLFLMYATIGSASEDNKQDGDNKQSEKPKNRFGLGVGVVRVRFDTNFKFTDKASGFRVFVDGEGTLGLPEKETLPFLYGYYRFARRHAIGFSYFEIKRESTLLQVNESTDFHLGDLTITAGANAKVTISDKSSFSYLSYNYTLFEDQRSFLFASFGLYGLDLTYGLDAEGEITLQGVPVFDERYSQEASVFAPLPLLGIDAWYFFTPKWALGTKISLVAGSYQDISALVLDTTVRAKYQFTKNIGMSLGITYFNAEVTIDEPDLKTEVDYGYDGIALGVDLRF